MTSLSTSSYLATLLQLQVQQLAGKSLSEMEEYILENADEGAQGGAQGGVLRGQKNTGRIYWEVSVTR